MSGGGGKGGSQTQKAEIPKWVEEPATRNLARAEDVQKLGYMPYYGVDVAGFTPMQQQAMQGTVNQAQAFGLAPQGMDAMAGMPQTTTQDGITGYSAGTLYDQALAEAKARNPEMERRYQQLFS